VAKIFLRSGSLADVLALGEDGQPVYSSALQLRETLRLRRQQQILDCLAIPQPNEQGDRLDWYSPVKGKVISWAAASNSERKSALSILDRCQTAVADMSRQAQKAQKTGHKLFGMLLAKTMQFPDQNYVYLVGGKPVLTFWGFVKIEQQPRSDALDCLRDMITEDEPLIDFTRLDPIEAPESQAAPPPQVKTVQEVKEQPRQTEQQNQSAELFREVEQDYDSSQPFRLTEQQNESTEPAHRAKSKNRAKSKKNKQSPATKFNHWRLWWAAPAIAILAVLTFHFGGRTTENQQSAPVLPTVNTDKPMLNPSPRMLASTPPQPVADKTPETEAPHSSHQLVTAINPAPSADKMIDASPVADDSKSKPVPAEIKTPASAEANSSLPAPTDALSADKTALRLPNQAVKDGSTTFLDGLWKVTVNNKDPATGKLPSFHFQLKNGRGLARLRYGNGVSCRTDIRAAMMKSGNLVMVSQLKARCSDGTNYQIPQITCKQTNSGIADCEGRYNADQIYQTTIKRENEK